MLRDFFYNFVRAHDQHHGIHPLRFQEGMPSLRCSYRRSHFAESSPKRKASLVSTHTRAAPGMPSMSWFRGLYHRKFTSLGSAGFVVRWLVACLHVSSESEGCVGVHPRVSVLRCATHAADRLVCPTKGNTAPGSHRHLSSFHSEGICMRVSRDAL